MRRSSPLERTQDPEKTADEAVFLSDIHLKSLEDRNGQALLRFFASLESRPSPPAIFLLGDIFDLWVSDHRVFVDRYRPLLESIGRLRARGAPVYYFEGNHDMHLAPYWEKVLGAEVRVRAGSFSIGGLRVRCEHGDEMNLDDKWYLLLRATLRHPLIAPLGHVLPGLFWDEVGRRWSTASRSRSAAERAAREANIRGVIRSHAERVWAEQPFDLIVSGHMHVRDDFSFEREGRAVRSVNLGSWFEEPKVLWLTKGHLHWEDV